MDWGRCHPVHLNAQPAQRRNQRVERRLLLDEILQDVADAHFHGHLFLFLYSQQLGWGQRAHWSVPLIVHNTVL